MSKILNSFNVSLQVDGFYEVTLSYMTDDPPTINEFIIGTDIENQLKDLKQPQKSKDSEKENIIKKNISNPIKDLEV